MHDHRDSGFTATELLIVVTIVTMIAALSTVAAVPRIARETLRSTVQDGATLARAARIEAVKRSRACRFVVDLSTRTMSVVDTNATATTADDVVLRLSSLPSIVSVARPDLGSPITFNASGSVYHVEFDSDGHVSTGAGEMVLFGGERYGKVVVYSGGGVRRERWDGSSWLAGS